jgi:PKD repeat protein
MSAPHFVLPLLLLSLGLAASASHAAPPAQRMFGAGAPFTVDSLPPGQLKNRLRSLPPQARSRAMHWLNSFSFPLEDLELVRIDDEGGVFYVDPFLPQHGGQQAGSAADDPQLAEISATDVFRLQSRPGATKVVYLDFRGGVISGTAWNASRGVASWNARAFDIDGSPDSFNATEVARMHEIWHRVAEDYSGFDINVTTQRPAAFGANVGRIMVTHSEPNSATPLPSATAGGVAYVNVWGRSDYSYHQPAFVYYNNLGSGDPRYIAEASSHELGHNLGLSHDGTSTGDAYYTGHGSGNVSWAPIMGVGYSRNVTQWSKGEYPNANQTQDDIAIIANKLGQRFDDHVNTRGAQSTPLQLEPDGRVIASNPELDPDNLLAANKGVLESRTDVDVFQFSAGFGTLSLTVTPAWDAFYRSANRGANADIQLTLHNAAGTVLAVNDPDTDTMATVSAAVQPGLYYLAVEGVAHPTNYNDYGSNGMYFINGSVPPNSNDVTAPTPNPMSFAMLPQASSDTSITMSAVSASDDSGVVQYRFACTSGGAGCTTSAWQTGTGYTASGLAPNTGYSFAVQARDLAGNETAWSESRAALTPYPNVAPTANFSWSCTHLQCQFTDGSSDSDGSVSAWQWGFGNGSGSTQQSPAHSYASGGIYNVSLTVTDNRGAQSTRIETITVSAPPPPAAPTALGATNGANGTAVLGWTDRSSDETGFELQRETLHKSGSFRGTTTIVPPIAGDSNNNQLESYTDNAGAGSHRYRVRAVNGSLASAWSGWVNVTVTTAGAGGCKGKCR